ncbi:glycosyltransferase family 2 protein [Gramella sp. BOM4]|nr:glycosyltransferase family 2 protein [Christiangramia bathymodioli]
MNLVSIIVPNYNHAPFLQERLDSIFNQSYQNFEVILLDDASTDNSLEILNVYASKPQVTHYIINETNSGSTFKQWDKGIKLAKGELVWIAETDDYCENNFLEEMLEFYNKNNDISLLFCQSFRMNVNGKVTGTWLSHTDVFKSDIFENDFIMDGNLFIEKFLIHKNVIPNVSGVLIKRKALNKITPLRFYPFMKYNADWFYYIQIICNSKVGFLGKNLNYFRYHESSVIAKAGSESGWDRIFEMELKGRQQMLDFIGSCRPGNFKAIKKQAKVGDDELIYLTSKGYINRGGFIKGLGIVWNKPKIFRKIFPYIIQKKYKRIWYFYNYIRRYN